MREEELIKKLENIELPEVSISSHKKRLRMALLNSDYFQKTNFFEVLRKSLVFTVPVLALFIFIGIVKIIIQPKLAEAKALQIVKNNPEIQKLMEDKKMTLGEVKIKDGRAFVLLNPQKESEYKEGEVSIIKIKKNEEGEIEEVEGAVVEVSLDEKKVTQINSIKGEDVISLANQEKESAKEIVESEEIVGEIIPKEAKIKKIQPSFPQKIHLIEKNGKMEVVSQPQAEKKAQVHYISDGKEWVIKVNLDKKRVEEIEYSSPDQNNKGRE